MNCTCAQLPYFDYYKPGRSLSRQIRPHIEKLKDTGFRELHRCRECGTYWCIDAHDKYQVRFAWKFIELRENWAEVEHTEEIKALMLKKRGGVRDEKCICLGCQNPRVKGSFGAAYGIDHLYAIGARE